MNSAFWDTKYDQEVYAYGQLPNQYLASQEQRIRACKTALVPGDGEGRNSVWLAELGLRVRSVDLSPVGVAKARRLAKSRGVEIDCQCHDLADWDWPVGCFDLVAAIYLHLGPELRPKVHAAMQAALSPGGLLVIEAFTPAQLEYQKHNSSGGPKQADLLYTSVMLSSDFGDLECLELTECEVDLREGEFHHGLGHVVRGLFRR
jgi:cyclopropane fatty-acyl-phospholipid synthase-like methyltransferase